ncbi:MAG: cation:dicarboxylase symporter family transporter [Synergistaceae bacterium]|nr:cation:dicarboxylase symporter family transporter [Synergistaceae bacterium]
MNKSKNKSKLVNIIALLLGGLVGCVLNITGHANICHVFLSPVGALYVNMLQFVALPLVFCLVIVSITSRPSVKKIASLACETIVSNIFSATLIGVIAFFVTIFFVTHNFLSLAPNILTSKHVVFAQNYMDKLMNTVPSGILGKFMRENLFFVLVVALLLGIFIVFEKGKLDYLTRMIASMNSVLNKMLGITVSFAPIGIFAITAKAFATNDLGVLENLFGLICLVLVICVVYLVIATFFVAIATKKSFVTCLATEYPAVFLGFVTTSSPACIPFAQKCADELGCHKGTSSFVVPLTNLLIKTGSTVNIYCLLAFVITASGTVMPLYKWFYMIFLAMVCALAVPAIPMGAVFVIPTALSFLNVTVNQSLMGLLFAVYAFIDMPSTAATCESNILCSIVVDKIEQLRKNRLHRMKELS